MTKRRTWEVVVWDGSRWFRPSPPVRFDSLPEAVAAVLRLRGLAPAQIMTSAQLDQNGLPQRPPISA